MIYYLQTSKGFLVEFVKRPNDGSMKGLAFIKDPDGYWIEILNADSITDLIGEHGALRH